MDAQHYRELLEENLRNHRPQLLRQLQSEGNLESYLQSTSEEAANQYSLLYGQYLREHPEPANTAQNFFARVSRFEAARQAADEFVRLNLIQLPNSDTEKAIRQGGYRDEISESPPTTTSAMEILFLPRSWDGDMLVRVAKTEDGGARTEVWRDGSWRPSSLSVGKVMGLPVATPSEIKAAGASAEG